MCFKSIKHEQRSTLLQCNLLESVILKFFYGKIKIGFTFDVFCKDCFQLFLFLFLNFMNNYCV